MRLGRLRVVATVVMVDGTTVATPDDERPFDRLQFERRFGEPWPVLDEDGKLGLSDEHVAYMAWIQLHRAELAGKQVTPDDFDVWMVDIASIEIDVSEPDEGDAGLPTPATPSTGG
jgi:hypothetical protein